MNVSDEQWLAEARDREARGLGWERSWDAIAASLRAVARPPAPTPQADAIRCPYCAAHPPLEVVKRFEVVSQQPLLRCPTCYGFWARGDALSGGVRDRYDEHPSFFAVVAPPRCRSCGGWLKPDQVCSKCGLALPILACPLCAKQMQRWKKDGVTLDECLDCEGKWFDVGEIGAVYGLEPPQSAAASLIDEHACDDEPPAWTFFLEGILRVLVPFI